MNMPGPLPYRAVAPTFDPARTNDERSPMNTFAKNLSLVSLAAALLSAGCAQTPSNQSPQTPEAPVSDAAYTGPAVAIESRTGFTHQVVISTPTGGWSVVWDGTFDTKERIYLTVRQPDPEFFHIQAFVQHRINSTIASENPLEIYIRVAEFGDHSDTAPYLRAAHTPK